MAIAITIGGAWHVLFQRTVAAVQAQGSPGGLQNIFSTLNLQRTAAPCFPVMLDRHIAKVKLTCSNSQSAPGTGAGIVG
jgi:hypothetical protein